MKALIFIIDLFAIIHKGVFKKKQLGKSTAERFDEYDKWCDENKKTDQREA